MEKAGGCKNNPENPYVTKVSKHIPSGFLMSTISSFRSIENKHGVYRGKDCMKRSKVLWILEREGNKNN